MTAASYHGPAVPASDIPACRAMTQALCTEYLTAIVRRQDSAS